METFIGIAIWVLIFLVWYIRNYPERVQALNPRRIVKWKWPRRSTVLRNKARPRSASKKDFKTLVERIEHISSLDTMGTSDAATMVRAIKDLLEVEQASGQLWEALALDSLENARIICDECRIPVEKVVRKTGVKIHCSKCKKWLALKNSKVTVIDPRRSGSEDWEH